jgi:hypothetical protein
MRTLRVFFGSIFGAATLFATFVSCVITTHAGAQEVDQNLWVTDGPMRVVKRVGNVLYAGGDFTSVGPYTGGGVPVDLATAARMPNFPVVRGNVKACTSDGAGGWFIGGVFDTVGGVARKNIAHVRADLTVGPLNVAPDDVVSAMALDGSTLYFGGSFLNVSGLQRGRLAAADVTTGALTSWAPTSYGFVYALLAYGGNLYVGGNFDNIGGSPRYGLASLDLVTGAATAWDPNATGPLREVRALVRQDTTLYVGGSFFGIGGASRNGLAAFGLPSGAVTSWTPASAYGTTCMALSSTTLYVGGFFTTLGGLTRNRIGAVSLATGQLTAFNPNANSAVLSLALSGSTLYVGGQFTTIGGQSRIGVAAVSATTGVPTGWQPSLRYGGVESMMINGSTVLLGGGFRIANAIARPYLAAFDVTTGAATAWNPAPNSPVYTIDSNAGTLYVGGGFTSIAGQGRNRLAAFDEGTGSLLTWNPNADQVVTTLDASGSPVYVGGAFAHVGGQGRSFLAAVDPVTGTPTDWNPGADSLVWKVVVDDGLVYAGGEFAVLGGVARRMMGAVDASGATTSWDPACVGADYGPNFPNPAVFDILPLDGIVYVGGILSAIGGQTRFCAGAVNAADGLATGWDPVPNWFVYALAHDDASIYIGGDFYVVGGQTRYRMAAVDRQQGAPTAWLGQAGSTVRTLDQSGTVLYAGGAFEAVNGAPSQYLAAVSTPSTVGVPDVHATESGVALLPSLPHPVRETAQLRFTLPSAAAFRLELIDLAGRRVRTLARDDVRAAGTHSVEFRRGGLAAGLYFLRLETTVGNATRRLMVLR